MTQTPKTFDEIIKETAVPVVVIDHNGFFTLVNTSFEKEYGWSSKELIGQSITMIIPPYLRDAHLVGISRFLITEQPTLMEKPLPLSILYKDGTIREAEHYITGKKQDGSWRFAASIKPLP
ncbi:MAG TPA: PAS domain S-box protein [Candidatus Saccharimonadales bacterium]|nr:PAS domain S-box protein [Candidatus Saccharimonadales bacterium]